MQNRLVATLVALAFIAGCGKSGQPDTAGEVQAATPAPVPTGADDVAAVLQSTGVPLAKLGFAVLASPVVGVQSGLRLDISATEPVPALLVAAESEGVTIDPASARINFALATAGAIASHELKFVPEHEGLTEVTVRLRADAASPETIYVIPLLVTKVAAGG